MKERLLEYLPEKDDFKRPPRRDDDDDDAEVEAPTAVVEIEEPEVESEPEPAVTDRRTSAARVGVHQECAEADGRGTGGG